MQSYIPRVWCAKCNKAAESVQRLSDGRDRFVRVRCHGAELLIAFTTDPNEQVRLWETSSTTSVPSN
jgi:hypothetical protein